MLSVIKISDAKVCEQLIVFIDQIKTSMIIPHIIDKDFIFFTIGINSHWNRLYILFIKKTIFTDIHF